MTLRDFRDLISTEDSYTLMAIRRKSGKGFQGISGDTWVDSAIGLSFCKREECGKDWNIGETPVIKIESIICYGQPVPCAIID